MTPQKKRSQGKRRQSDARGFTIRGIRHDPPDIRKLAKVIVSLAATTQGEEASEHSSTTTQESTTPPEERHPRTHREAA